MKKLLFLFFLHSTLFLNGQQVTTIFNSSNMQIDDAIIQDSRGNIYGSHYMGSRVYKISTTGIVSIFKAGLNTPNGLALDSQDNLYIVDNIGNRIYKLDSTGNQLFSVTVNSPSGIIKDINSDTMIITQYSGHAVRKLAPNGQINNNPMHYGYPLNGPVGLCYGLDSTLFVGSFGDRKIYKFINDTIQYVAQIPGNNNVNLGFITQANGLIYGTSFFSDKIYEINPNYIDSVKLFAGSTQGNFDGPIGTARFNDPNGIFASKSGDSLLISDFNTGNIRMITGLITGIKEKNKKSYSVSIYPNPSINIINIHSDLGINKIEIYSITGKLLIEKAISQLHDYELNHQLNTGNYILKIQGKKTVRIDKLVVIH